MRKILFILSIFFSIAVLAQMPTNGNYSNWDWSNQNQNNWKMKQDSKWVDISPPFLWNTDKSEHLDNIYKTQDYTYAKGWRLVHAQFDGAYPYFILYNVYKSILRTYIYTGTTVNFKGIMTVLTPSEKLKESKILNSAVAYQYAIDDKRKIDITNLSVLDTHSGLATWSVADFLMSFDSNINSTIFQNQKWNIAFYTTNQMDVKLNITGTSTPVPVDQLMSFSGSTGSLSSGGFNAAYSRVNKLIQSGDDYFGKAQKSAEKIKDTAWKPLLKYKETIGKLSKVGDFLSAASSISAGIGVFASFVDIFSGGLGPQSVPMGYIHNLDATGTITFQQKMRETQFQVPGVSYSYGARPAWAFQCPMGIINLKSAPKIRKTTPYLKVLDPFGTYKKYKKSNWTGIDSYYYKESLLGQIVYPKLYSNLNNNKRNKVIKYCFEDHNISVLKQEIEGLQIKDISLSIVCKINNTLDFHLYSITDPKYGFVSLEPAPLFIFDIINPVYNYLESGKFIIHKYGDSDKDMYFGTPYVNINSLKKTIFEVPANTDVLLGVLVTYYAPNTSEPQIFKALYRFDEIEEKAQKDAIFFEEVQGNFGTSEGTLLKSTVATFNSNCQSTKTALRSSGIFTESSPWNVKLYPIPTDGVLNISVGDFAKSYEVRVFDMMGRLVISKSNNVGIQTLDMSSYAKGTYIIDVVSDDQRYQSKFILK